MSNTSLPEIPYCAWTKSDLIEELKRIIRETPARYQFDPVIYIKPDLFHACVFHFDIKLVNTFRFRFGVTYFAEGNDGTSS